jgi:hypothetical protein
MYDIQISEVLLCICLCSYCALCPQSEIQGYCLEGPGFSCQMALDVDIPKSCSGCNLFL